jgi:methyltransferase family protein
MLLTLKSFLTHPLVRGLDIDAPKTNEQISRMIREKAFLKKIYSSWYLEIEQSLPQSIDGPVIELGSGAGFLKDFIPSLITSEVLKIPNVDISLDGCRLPCKNQSLKGIVMIDVFHHIPNVYKFLHEASFCIKPGGVIVMIEPWITKWSKFIFSNLHHEPIDDSAKDWKLKDDGGPLSLANSALPWIVFDRDQIKFKRYYPEWKIKNKRLHTPFSYLLSGGVSLKSLIPGYFYKFCQHIEYLLKPFMPAIAMFATITLERKE